MAEFQYGPVDIYLVGFEGDRLDPATLKSDFAAHLSMLHEVRRRADSFDVLHFHLDLLHFPFFEEIAACTLTTLHGRLDLKDLAGAYRRWPQYPLAAVASCELGRHRAPRRADRAVPLPSRVGERWLPGVPGPYRAREGG